MAREKVTLTAGVQYNDFKGTLAADEENLFSVYLRDNGFISDSEVLIALDIYAGLNDPSSERQFDIYAYVVDGKGIDDVDAVLEVDPIQARKVYIEIPVLEFFRQFKRFNMILTNPHLNLDGREIQG